MEVLANAKVIIISQYTSVSNQHIVYLKQFYISKNEKEKGKDECIEVELLGEGV